MCERKKNCMEDIKKVQEKKSRMRDKNRMQSSEKRDIRISHMRKRN